MTRFAPLALFVIAAVLAAVLANPAQADPVAGAAEALNAYRAARGLPPVTLSAKLQKAAQSHGSDMAKRGYFAHNSPDGSTPAKRARRAGYRYCYIAENIAKGQKSLDQVMQGWANSPPHARNMSSAEAREFALSRSDGNIWVMMLGRSGC